MEKKQSVEMHDKETAKHKLSGRRQGTLYNKTLWWAGGSSQYNETSRTVRI